MAILPPPSRRRIWILAGISALCLSACGGASAPPATTPPASPALTLAGPPVTANMTADAAGNLYFADATTYTIQKRDSAGRVTVVAGTPGVRGVRDGTGAAAEFYAPNALAVDAAGNLYVSESNAIDTLGDGVKAGTLVYRAAIRKITPAGVVTTLAGSTGAGSPTDLGYQDGVGTAARFNVPQELAVDSQGNVFVADYRNWVIRKITPQGQVSTVAGSLNPQVSADPTRYPGIAFGEVYRLKIDDADNLYVLHSAGVGTALTRISADGRATTLGRGLYATNIVVHRRTGALYGVTPYVRPNLLYRISDAGVEADSGVALPALPSGLTYAAPDAAAMLSNGVVTTVQLP